MSDQRRTATVLVIEGNQKTRGELHRALEAAGWRVVCAWDAQDVAGVLTSTHQAIDAAVVDMAMMGPGNDLVRIVQDKHPGVSFIFKPSPGSKNSIPAGHTVTPEPCDVPTVVKLLSELPRGNSYGLRNK